MVDITYRYCQRFRCCPASRIFSSLRVAQSLRGGNVPGSGKQLESRRRSARGRLSQFDAMSV